MPRRYFTLRDAVILVAATGIAVAWLRPSLQDSLREEVWSKLSTDRHSLFLVCLGLPILLVWTFTIIALRLIPPRPSRRRLTCQPGFVGAVAGMAPLSIVAAAIAAWAVIRKGPDSASFAEWLVWTGVDGVTLFSPLVAMGTLIGWGLLWLGRRWRPEPDWIDRAGRILCLTWIATSLPIGIYLIGQLIP